ncbi:hypothetical protein ACFSHQ_13860 [Gemmobacter lanyuensis]
MIVALGARPRRVDPAPPVRSRSKRRAVVPQMKSAISFMALLALLAACEKEVILPGERFGTRTPLDASLATTERPSPTDPLAVQKNEARPISLPAAVANADWPQRGAMCATCRPMAR